MRPGAVSNHPEHFYLLDLGKHFVIVIVEMLCLQHLQSLFPKELLLFTLDAVKHRLIDVSCMNL